MGRKVISVLLCLFGCTYSATDPVTMSTGKGEMSFWNWDIKPATYSIHYIEKGEGSQHLIFLHGYGANTFTWKHQLDVFAKQGYHTWAVDLLGFGFSDKPAKIKYSIDLFQRQILDFMDAHQIQKAHLIGNSMGGGLALSIAVSAPKRVSSLVVIDPLAYPIDLPFPYSLGKTLGKITLPFFSRKLVFRTLKQIVYNPERISSEQIDAYWQPYEMKGGREAAINVLQAFDKKILEQLSLSYGAIDTPVLILWGDRDRWIPVDHLNRLADQIPGAKKQLISACGHIPQEEKPEEVNQLLLKFLRGLPPSLEGDN